MLNLLRLVSYLLAHSLLIYNIALLKIHQYAIIDDINVLPRIKEAFDSKNFRDLMEECEVSDMSINRKVIALFRKDFWKEFLG